MRLERIHDDDNLEQVKEKLATVIDLLLYEEIKRQSFDKFKDECFDLIQSKEDYHIKRYSELKDETKKEFDNTIKELNENFNNDINGQYNLIEETINKLKDVENKSKEETQKVYSQIDNLDNKYKNLFMDIELKIKNLEIKNNILVKFIKNISEGVKEL